ncbi:MAG: hypothetical protein HGB14_07845 [Anaerolineaceae bacterium]|nr:hypothetical protein [Anaerolineaceae bacterium]
MIVAEIITIGTELLLGEIQDTNTRFLVRQLRELGINLYRTTMIGDNKDRIADLIKETITRSDLIITTGGLGPTVDDPTREAVALSFNTSLEFDPLIWDQIAARFTLLNRIPTENNKRQAYFPKGAIVIKNPVGTAPAFIVDSGKIVLVSLPGVPSELEYLFQNEVIPFLKQRFELQSTIKVHVLHVSGMGESAVDELIGDLEELANPTVGLLAHSGQIDIRIAASAASEKDAEILISPIRANSQ